MNELTPRVRTPGPSRTLSSAMEVTRLARLAAQALPESPARATIVAHFRAAQEAQRRAMEGILAQCKQVAIQHAADQVDGEAATPEAVPQVPKAPTPEAGGSMSRSDVTIGGHTLILGKAEDVLPTLDDASVQLIVTPPISGKSLTITASASTGPGSGQHSTPICRGCTAWQRNGSAS